MQDEVAHDAVQLLDRAMMALDKPAADCMSAAAPAGLYLAVCQDNQHSRDALPLLSGISNLTGLTTKSLLMPHPCSLAAMTSHDCLPCPFCQLAYLFYQPGSYLSVADTLWRHVLA